ncbi:two-component system, NarL family, sensor histidine kinase EvgS [Methylomarinovum caldicuralii]|uniref:histidine kinase n=1 Tax=Methylomarinovum caldicuralii TaxID=438856 RepID=A0AAU9C254_9GAMM|nr:transporter substrate-binding domain-containing protein [Methylomarinovum caldicuralii]BCX81240.1 two-component system, NarL family, sensor histidine kinase EvgS [Methylomarinovum caldicuralii]
MPRKRTAGSNPPFGCFLFRLWLALLFLAAALPARALDLTPEERAFLDAHPVIRLGVDGDYAPYSFFDEEGRFRGVAADFAARLEAMLGIHFQPVAGLAWTEILDAVRKRRLDAVATVVKLPERESYLAFTAIYLPTPLVIMTRTDTPPLPGPQALTGMETALVKGYSSARQALERYPGIVPVWVDTPLAGLRAVAAGEADAYVGVLGVNTWLMQHYGLTNLKVNAAFDMVENGQRFGVRKDWGILARILDKALAAIPQADRQAIFRRWLPVAAESIPVLGTGITLAEQRWLQRLPPQRIGIPAAAAPFAFIDDQGNPAGIAVDMLHWIQDRTGLTLAYRPAPHREALLAMLQRRELELAVVATADDTPLPGVRLTPPLHRTTLMIFGGNKPHFSGGLAELAGRPVAVCRHGPAYDLLKRQPGLQLVAVEKPAEALQAVARGRAEAAVMEVTLGLQAREAAGLEAVQPHAPVTEATLTLRLAVRADRPRLAELLDRLVRAIPPPERAAILARWLGLPRRGLDPRVLWWLGGGAGAAVVIVLLVLLWNWMLQRELARRQRREHELLEQAQARRALLEALLDSIPDLFFRIGPDGTILEGHSPNPDLFYVPPQQFLGKTMQEVLPPPLAARFSEALERLRQDGGPVTLEYALEVPGGKHWFEAKLSPVRGSDEAVVLVHDITARKQAEAALQAARDRLEQRVAERTAELSAANRELEAFTYAVSHDLRAPLRAIQGFAQALEEDYGEALPAGAGEFLDEIAAGAHRMGELIDGLLTLSRISRAELVCQPVRLDQITHEIFAELRRREPHRRVRLEIPGPLEAEADLRLCRILVQNLLENAWKYTAGRKDAWIRFSAREEDGERVFCLEDNGAGFDMAFAAKLFEPFQRLHAQSEFPGLGIGLATVQRIVRRPGGWIRGEGTVGGGARFLFTLAPKGGQHHGHPNPTAGGGQSPRREAHPPGPGQDPRGQPGGGGA